jgi:glutaredoxin
MENQQVKPTNIIVYTKPNCVYCTKAKRLLETLRLDYKEKKLQDFTSIDELLEDIGKNVKSMPQIKINGELVGGYNQLMEYFVDKKQINFQGNIIKDE